VAFKRFLISGLLSAVGLCFLLLISSSASAATQIVSGGQLLGATGVIVDGNSYNVEFLDGTCIALYSGCEEVSDFTFQSEVAAGLAAQALLDQVFLDGDYLFDTDPELTNGCENVNRCASLTPYGAGSGTFDAYITTNFGAPESGEDTTQSAEPWGSSTFNSGSQAALTFAVWSPVPEPGTAVLMGLGLLGLSVRNRREV